MPRYPTDPLNVGKPLSRHTLPLRDRGAIDSQSVRDLGYQAAALSDQVHTVHATMLSTTERSLQLEMLRTPYHGQLHYAGMEISDIIRLARRRKGLSQRALAQKMEVAPSAVGQWETGVTLPKIKNRIDLVAILGIPFADLLPEDREGRVSSSDPQIVALVRQFGRLPAQVRESILMQVVATAEALQAPSPKPDED